MPSSAHTIISDLLTALKVPFTESYTKQRFETMPFMTLFGVTQLLKEYGVESFGYNITDKEEIGAISAPFVAQTRGGLVLVSKVGADSVTYITEGVAEDMPLDEFKQAWTGTILYATASAGAREPDYSKHWRMCLIDKAKTWLLCALGLALIVYLLIVNHTWRDISVIALTVIDLIGIWLTFLLVQKSLSIKNPVADKVCGVLQEGGCDSILKTSASSFFGIFSWSEVGFTYFGVSLIAMLIYPAAIHWLALINICCLPYTVWSITYQKFVAKHWCTLCVSVQLSLWLQFFCYLFGHWQTPIFPLDLGFFALGACFIFVLLLLNKVLPHFSAKNS